jgi:hypothetical protein
MLWMDAAVDTHGWTPVVGRPVGHRSAAAVPPSGLRRNRSKGPLASLAHPGRGDTPVCGSCPRRRSGVAGFHRPRRGATGRLGALVHWWHGYRGGVNAGLGYPSRSALHDCGHAFGRAGPSMRLEATGSACRVLFGVVDVEPTTDRRPAMALPMLTALFLAALHLGPHRAALLIADSRARLAPGNGRHRRTAPEARHAARRQTRRGGRR